MNLRLVKTDERDKLLFNCAHPGLNIVLGVLLFGLSIGACIVAACFEAWEGYSRRAASVPSFVSAIIVAIVGAVLIVYICLQPDGELGLTTKSPRLLYKFRAKLGPGWVFLGLLVLVFVPWPAAMAFVWMHAHLNVVSTYLIYGAAVATMTVAAWLACRLDI